MIAETQLSKSWVNLNSKYVEHIQFIGSNGASTKRTSYNSMFRMMDLMPWFFLKLMVQCFEWIFIPHQLLKQVLWISSSFSSDWSWGGSQAVAPKEMKCIHVFVLYLSVHLSRSQRWSRKQPFAHCSLCSVSCKDIFPGANGNWIFSISFVKV